MDQLELAIVGETVLVQPCDQRIVDFHRPDFTGAFK